MEDDGYLESTYLQCITCTLKHTVINLHQGSITLNSKMSVTPIIIQRNPGIVTSDVTTFQPLT